MHPSLKALRDPFTSRLRRRVVTVPSLFLAWLLVTALLPLLVVAGVVADGVRGGSWVITRSVVFFAWFLTCEAAGLVVAFALWLGLSWSEPRFLAANGALQSLWNRALLFGGARVFAMGIDVEGSDALAPGPLLVLTRHVSTVDAVIPVSILRGFRFRFVLKRELLSDPCLDVVGNRLPNCFAARGSGNTEGEVARVLALLTELAPSDAVVVYPEGTRFTAARRDRLLAKAREHGDAATENIAASLHHTLPPLTTGTLALLRDNPGADVVVIAHTGLEGAASFADFSRGGLVGARVKVKLWRVPFAQIPRDDDGRVAFLAAQWRQVDAFVEEKAREAHVPILLSSSSP